MQLSPADHVVRQREQLDFLRTVARLGLPLVLPIKEGIGPLGLILFIFRFRLSDSAVDGIEDVVKIT